jgi:D-proline reductase (dithiol) PrdB
VCLLARHFEARGLPTLILGSALDILQAGKPPRAKFLNYPLGFEAGRPLDRENQLAVVSEALKGFDAMEVPGIDTLAYDWEEGWRMIEDRNRSRTGTDQRSPRDTTPRYQTERDRELAERRR